jgi:hypothetical protein
MENTDIKERMPDSTKRRVCDPFIRMVLLSCYLIKAAN